MANVDEWELGHLFDIAEWTQIRDITQTLRSAAKFGLLERVPDRTGRYSVTNRGREAVLHWSE